MPAAGNGATNLLAGIGIGAAVMYFMDPQRGARRRALLADQLASALGDARDVAGLTARDVRNRAQGVVAETRSKMEPEEVADEVLVARVRSAMGRVVTAASAIDVIASEGTVQLRGDVLASEVEDLIACVRDVRGVEKVENELDVHASAAGVPALQGHGLQQNSQNRQWSPTERLLAGAAGGAIALMASRRDDLLGRVAGAAGLALAARSVTPSQHQG